MLLARMEIPRYTVIILLIVIGAACSRKFGIQRGITAGEDPGHEALGANCRRAQLGDMAITVEPVVYDEWNRILAYPSYSARQSGADMRLPRLSIFQCIITAGGDRAIPLSGIQFSLRAGDTELKQLDYPDIEKRLSSPAYSGFNRKNLFSWKRLLGAARCSDAIRYESDIIDYRLDFLAPGDSLIRMVAMDWLPVQYREMTLRVSAGAGKKSIDFRFSREEYRTRGRHFTDPVREGKGDAR